jgi:hypothetical protein
MPAGNLFAGAVRLQAGSAGGALKVEQVCHDWFLGNLWHEVQVIPVLYSTC